VTTIVESDPQIVEQLVKYVGPAEVVGSIEHIKAHLSARPQEFSIVVGPSVSLTAAVALADTMRVARPALGVILVRETIDTAVLAAALRSGMREVVPLDDLSGLDVAVKWVHGLADALSSSAPSHESKPEGKVITVFSAKGGVGKTTITTNLAVALADGGAREVCIVDLDLSFGDVAIALQIFPTHTIAETVAMQSHLDSEGLDPLLTHYRDGVYALAAPVQPDAKDTISAQLVGKILQVLRQRFAYVIVDTPPAFDDQVLQAFDESDLIVLVATPDIPALKNLKIACEMIGLLNIPREHLRVVLNRADSRVGVSPDEVAASLQMQITSSVPSSRDVPASINRGELLYLSDPRHPVSQSIAALAKVASVALHPLGEPQAVVASKALPVARPVSPPGGARRRKTGLFARKGRE